jgi:putative SOS response-associated peptidase YedK
MPARLTLTKLPKSIKYNNFEPNYNISPSQKYLIIIKEDNKFKIKLAKWGIQRDFTNQPLINARSEKIAENKTFGPLIEKNRCLVLADSFIEWIDENNHKQPYRIMQKDEKVFAIAGVYEIIGNEIFVAILTCDSNNLLKQIHPRMPVIIKSENWQNYFEKNYSHFLTPAGSEELKYYKINPKINNPKNNNEELLKEYKQKNLFESI